MTTNIISPCPGHCRKLLVALAALASLGTPSVSVAQSGAFPVRPVRIVVPAAPGGATDNLARVLAEQMGSVWGQTVIVDNRPGAAGIVGIDFATKAPADGHTMVLALSSSLLVNQYLYRQLPYDPAGLAQVYQVAIANLVLVVHPSVTARTGPELLQYVRANKGKLAYGSYGIGSYPHLAGMHMSTTQSADMTHVPFKGEAPMVHELLSGRIHMAYASAFQVKPHLQSGALRAIGVSGERRMGTLPEIATLAEQGLDDGIYRTYGWLGIQVPAGTSAATTAKIADAVRTAVHKPEVARILEGMGMQPQDSSPEHFREIYRRQAPVWEKLVRDSGIQLD